MRARILTLALVIFWSSVSFVWASEMRVAVTTSFYNSGLSELLLPQIKKDLDLDVHLLVVGTGQALKLGRQGDVDAILVHSRAAEDEFVQQGYAPYRREIMYNDFVLIGPANDPAVIGKQKTARAALSAIFKTRQIFVSRGDDSGTHRKEKSLWASAGKNSGAFDSTWYRASGSGMGATLNMASAMDGYVLADRASWLNFANKRNLKLLFSGDPVLFNQYAYLPINPVKYPHVKADLAVKLENWLVSKKGQQLIANYKLAGEQLFVPNAER